MSAHRVIEPSEAELDGLEPLWREMVAHHDAVVVDSWPVRDAGEAWRLRRAQYPGWLADGSGRVLVATLDGAAADGYAMVRVQPSPPTWDLGEQIGELESLAVAAHARGAGVGTLLIEAARALVRRDGVGYWSVAVVEANAGAVRLYEREGFRPFHRLRLGRID